MNHTYKLMKIYCILNNVENHPFDEEHDDLTIKTQKNGDFTSIAMNRGDENVLKIDFYEFDFYHQYIQDMISRYGNSPLHTSNDFLYFVRDNYPERFFYESHEKFFF